MFDAVIYGARASITIGLLATLGGHRDRGPARLASPGSSAAGVDALLSRVIDIVFGLPFLLGAHRDPDRGPVNRNAYTISFVLIVLGWAGDHPDHAVVGDRGQEQDYVQAARALGAGNGRIMFRHILPNAIAPVLVVATIASAPSSPPRRRCPSSASGLQAPTISWGMSISQARGRFVEAPHLLLFPSLFLS